MSIVGVGLWPVSCEMLVLRNMRLYDHAVLSDVLVCGGVCEFCSRLTSVPRLIFRIPRVHTFIINYGTVDSVIVAMFLSTYYLLIMTRR